MKIRIKNNKERSFKAFLLAMSYWKHIRKRLEEKLNIKFNDQDIKNAKKCMEEKKNCKKLKSIHDKIWADHASNRKEITNVLKKAIKTKELVQALNKIPKFTKINWKKKSFNIYLICDTGKQGFNDGIGIGFLEKRELSERFIQGIIHELIHFNTYAEIEKGTENINAREIATVIITNLISEELGIKRKQRFEGSYEKYWDKYEELKALNKESKDYYSFWKRIKKKL